MTSLRTSRIRPLKSLGQNFLRDPNIARKIIAAIDPRPGDVIVEIGPGEGALTQHLVRKGQALTVIDIDPRVILVMEAMFGDGAVDIVHGDFLATDLGQLAAKGSRRIRIVGNIPYNITSPILFHVLDNRLYVEDLTIMVQKEVARRVIASPGSSEYGILSVFCGYFADPRLLFEVSPNAFFPKPNVTSAVLHLRMREQPVIPATDEEFFRAMVRSVFSKRRKTLRNSLAYFADERDFPLPDLPGYTRRPEVLSITELVQLSNKLFTYAHDHDTRPRNE